MQNHQTSTPTSARNPILASLADERRRRTLAILLDRNAPVAERDLATHLVADEQAKSLVDVTEDEVESVQVPLRHVHLPALDEADLVDWNRDAKTATTTNHPALQDPRIQAIVETTADDWDAVVESLANRRRRIVLSVLRDESGELSFDELIETVREKQTDAPGVSSPDSDDVRRSLYHVHLPKLDDAGLVRYDADSREVTFEGHPSLDDAWLTFARDEAPRAIV